MKSRGKVVLALVLTVAVGAAFTLAFAATKMPDKPIVINSKDVFKKLKKAPVVFTHKKHKEFKCIQCHHEYKDGKNVWKEGDPVKKCSECHNPLKKQGKAMKLKNAYHKNCKNCHKALAKAGKKTGPFKKCNECHQKKS
jgi:hypothetical protein